MKSISLLSCPFLKEELQNITVVFEDYNELKLDYVFQNLNDNNNYPPGFANYYKAKQRKSFIKGMPMPNIETIYREFIKKII